METTILGVNINTYNFNETLEMCKGYLESNKPHMIFTPNPEVIIKANENPTFMKILNDGDLIIPDGIGIVLASKLYKIKIKERVTGYDLSLALLDYIKDTDFTVYFFGSAVKVAERAKENMEAKLDGLKVVGCHDGVDFMNKRQEIIDDINQRKPDMVFVGLGMVNQETWIYENAKHLDTKLLIGFGGVLDHFAGDIKRAPIIYQKLGLEWLYRRVTLKRKGRQKAINKFIIKVAKERFGKHKGKI
jgi:N-acetylglucosaminyldiphosphoundecaprenol N-acetyl-beta-D-mannosaminyltransferase